MGQEKKWRIFLKPRRISKNFQLYVNILVNFAGPTSAIANTGNFEDIIKILKFSKNLRKFSGKFSRNIWVPIVEICYKNAK